MEHWQQETAEALTRRLLVASMACVLVWRVSRQPGPEGESLHNLLVRLSGRLVKRGQQPWTLPALLEGLWVLLAMVAVSGGLHDRTACSGAYRPGRERRPQHEEQDKAHGSPP